MDWQLETSSRESALSYIPQLAYIIHQPEKQDCKCIITSHQINDQGQLEVGQVMDEHLLSDLKGSIASEALVFNQHRILAVNASTIVFYVPARPFLFRVADHKQPLGYAQYMIPMPNHVLYVHKQSQFEIGGFAVMPGEVSGQTELFHSPTFNTYQSGKMCIGSVKLSKEISTCHIDHWVEEFFSSVGTNIKHNCINVAEGEKCSRKILDLNDKPTFPAEYLKKSEIKTVADLLLKLGG